MINRFIVQQRGGEPGSGPAGCAGQPLPEERLPIKPLMHGAAAQAQAKKEGFPEKGQQPQASSCARRGPWGPRRPTTTQQGRAGILVFSSGPTCRE